MCFHPYKRFLFLSKFHTLSLPRRDTLLHLHTLLIHGVNLVSNRHIRLCQWDLYKFPSHDNNHGTILLHTWNRFHSNIFLFRGACQPLISPNSISFQAFEHCWGFDSLSYQSLFSMIETFPCRLQFLPFSSSFVRRYFQIAWWLCFQ